jgi:macrolide-specific efflux system membrane fusion protein
VYGIDVTIDLPNAQVKPGMTGTATVIIASKQGVLTVPNLAIRTTAGRRYLQVLKDGEAVDTDVTFGIANDTTTEVVSGVAEGDLVVLPAARATATARPGVGGGGFGGGGGGAPVIIGR